MILSMWQNRSLVEHKQCVAPSGQSIRKKKTLGLRTMEINITMKREPEELREALTRMAGTLGTSPFDIVAVDLGQALVW